MPLIPHILTLSRVAAAPFLIWLLIAARFREALLLVLVAALTDWFDGYAARKLGVAGNLGVILDPIADKSLALTLFLTLGYVGLIPVWLLALVIGRDFIIVGGSLLLRIFRGVRRFIPSIVGKVSTFFQIVFVLLVLVYASFAYPWILWLRQIALALSAVFTVVSGLDYIRKGIRLTRRLPVT